MKSSCAADVHRPFTSYMLSHSFRIQEDLAGKPFNSSEKRLDLLDVVHPE